MAIRVRDRNVQRLGGWVLGRAAPIGPPSASFVCLLLELGQGSATRSLDTGSDVTPKMAAMDCRKGDSRESKIPCKK